MDLADARQALQDRGFDYLDTSRLDIMLNNGKNSLEDEYQWPWLETSTSGTAPLTISDLKYVESVVDSTTRVPLVGVDKRLLVDTVDPILTTTGVPAYWWLEGEETLNVYPANTSVSLSVYYVKFSPELSAAADEPLIPVRYHPVWIDYACVEAYRDSDNFEAADKLLGSVRQHRLSQMIEVYSTRNRQNSGYQHTSVFSSGDW